jgi:L-alanine-DL-glutamate epimerase-like enolase superfamily enzyme
MGVIDQFELLSLPVELGRLIGDNSCAYDRMTIVALRLRIQVGHEAWGYNEVQTHGTFVRDAFWIRPLPDLAVLQSIFEAQWWPSLHGRQLDDLADVRAFASLGRARTRRRGTDRALRLAGTAGRSAALPLYRVFNPAAASDRKRAYGSLLDFPLSDEDAVDVAQAMLEKGITAIKIKVGASDADRDIHRLCLIQSVIRATSLTLGRCQRGLDLGNSAAAIGAIRRRGSQARIYRRPSAARRFRRIARTDTALAHSCDRP